MLSLHHPSPSLWACSIHCMHCGIDVGKQLTIGQFVELDSALHCCPSLAWSPPLLYHSHWHCHYHLPLSVTTWHGSQALSKDEDLTQRASSLGMHCDGIVYLHTQVMCIYTFYAQTIENLCVHTSVLCLFSVMKVLQTLSFLALT